MIIMARTTYTRELLQRFIRFNLFRSHYQVIAYCFSEVLMLGMVGYMIYTAISSGRLDEIIMAIAVSVLLILSFPLMLIFLPQIMVSTSRGTIGAVNTYLFADGEVIIESNLPTFNGQTQTKYDHMHCIYETGEVFYIYMTMQSAFILLKADIVGGSVEDLRAMFMRNLPSDKFVSRLG